MEPKEQSKHANGTETHGYGERLRVSGWEGVCGMGAKGEASYGTVTGLERTAQGIVDNPVITTHGAR